MTNVHLDWPEDLLTSIVDELEAIGIDEGTAEMAADVVASRLVVEIAEGRLHVERVGDTAGGAGESRG